MATNARVGINVDLIGDEEAISRMKTLESMVKGLNGHRAKVRLDGEIHRLELNKAALKAAKIKLDADMTKVNAAIKKTKAELTDLQKRMNAPAAKTGLYDPKAYRDLFRLKNEISDLNKQKISIKSDMSKTNADLKEATNLVQQYKTALKGLQTMSLGQIWGKTASKISHMGQAMQSMGNALTRMASPIRNMMRYMGIGAGFAAFGKISEGITSGFSRYDTMKKYPKIMSAFGYSAEQAQKSIDALDKSVRGLPTGLDEMVDMSQRFTATTGDIEKGTKLAIAANNAFLASMSTDTQRYQGMMQLQDVLGGKKMNAREWNSLVSSMTPAIVKMGESLGYTNDNMDEWIQKVRDGKVANEDFIDTLIKVGNEGGEVAKMANESKDTWQAFSANIGNAFSRMAAGVIQSMDTVVASLNLVDADGRKLESVNRLLSDRVIPGIDRMTESAKKWIKAHPDEIIGFFDSLKSVNWSSLGKGFAKGMMNMAKGIQAMAKMFGGKNLALIGKGMAYLLPLGSMFTVMGGLLKGGRHLIALLPTIGIGIGRGLAALGSGFGLAGAASFGKKITDFMKTFGKVKAATDTAEAVAKGAASKGVKLGGHMKMLAKGLSSIGAVAAVPVIIGGSIMITVKAIKSIVKDLGTISSDMGKIDPQAMKQLGKVAAIIGGIFTGLGAVTGLTGGGLAIAAGLEAGLLAVGAILTTISGFAWVNSKLISGTVRNLSEAVTSVGDIAKGINDLDGVTVSTAGIDRVAKSIATVMEHLDKLQSGGSDSGTWLGNQAAKKLKKKFDNIGAIVGTLKQSANDMKAISEVDSYAITQAGNTMKNLVAQLDDVYAQMKEDFVLTSTQDVNGSERGATIIDSITGMISNVKQSLGDLQSLSSTFDYRPAFGNLKNVVSGMKKVYDEINAMFAGQGSDSKGVTAKTGKMGQGDIAGIGKRDVTMSERQSGWIRNIKGMMEQVKGVYDALTAEGGMADVDVTTFATMLRRTESIISQISTAWGNWKVYFAKFKNAQADAESMKGIETAIGSIKSMMATLASIGTGLNQGAYGQSIGEMTPDFGRVDSLGTGGGSATSFIDTALKNITAMMEKVREFAESVQQIPNIENLSANMDGIKSAVSKIKDTMNELTSLGEGSLASTDGAAFTAINNIKTMISRLGQALNTEALAGLQAQIDTFRASIQQMFQALNADFANVKVVVNINGEVKGHTALIGKVKAADKAIRAAVNSIRTSYTKTVTVNIVGHVNRSGNFGGVTPHTGGYISGAGGGRLLYRNKGGGIGNLFKPKGTDTVPAMLTPGEYVHKKAAVDFWGLDFMRKINHMDVRGVMRAANAKARGVMNTTRHTIINNNTTNNNQKVTQNISTTNPNFAYRRSQRWVGAI